MKRVFTLIAGLSLLILLFSGCADNGGEKVIKIGVFEPLSGENGEGGSQELIGIQYANKMYPTVNINGVEYKIELVTVDNKSDKTEAVTVAQSLVNQGVSAVIGSYGSGVSIAAGQTFADAKIPAVGASCTNPQVTDGNNWYFRICFIDPFQGTVMANYAYKNGYETAAVITQKDDDYSVGLGEYFTRVYKNLGGEIVAEKQFETGQTDFTDILSGIKVVNPDIVFAPSSIATAPLLLKQAREMGIEAVFAAGDTWENTSVVENAGDAASGAVFSTFFDEAEPTTPEAAVFITGFKSYLKENGHPETIPAVSALGYDAYLTVFEAIKDANSADASKIRDALKKVTVVGVTGTILFDNNGDANKDMAFIKTIENGKIVFLETVTIG